MSEHTEDSLPTIYAKLKRCANAYKELKAEHMKLELMLKAAKAGLIMACHENNVHACRVALKELRRIEEGVH